MNDELNQDPMLSKTKFAMLFALLCILKTSLKAQTPIISEFMAINNATIQDNAGNFSDWIEIHNPGDTEVNLLGFHLTDNSSELNKWTFPDVTMAAGSYLLVFASDDDKTDPAAQLHTNFKLSGSGEYLALIGPDGTVIHYFGQKYPAQQADRSYGMLDGNEVFFDTPTPGASNSATGQLLAPVFSHTRGFYESGFSLTIDNLNDGTDIIFTTNGNRPGLTVGETYTEPITIDKTTVLSAVVVDVTNNQIGEIVAQTYIFDDVLNQSNSPEGYPDRWTPVESAFFPGDYEMDPEVCTDENRPVIFQALKDLPTISLVLDIDDLFLDSEHDSLSGMYLNSIKHTDEWERPGSFEYFDPNNKVQFQVNCGLRIHGGNGRKPSNSPKHSLRAHFRSKYGPSKLNFNMFEDKSATNEFNALVFRAGYNYSWLKNNPDQCLGTDYIRDPFTKKTQLDMDRTAAHRKFAHLYLNGLYWGVFDISEKITNDFTSEYLGGKEDDYDVIKDHDGVTDGDRVAWDSLLVAVARGLEDNSAYQKIQGRNEDGSINPGYQNLLDVRNLTDYMLINFFIGNGDWDRNNWLAARNRVTNDEGFKFFCWDAETSMNDLNENKTDLNNPTNPSGIFNELMKNKEYRLYFADRVQKHFYNQGALTPEKTIERYNAMVNEMGNALWAESARWGDYRRDVDNGGKSYDLYTMQHWENRVNEVTQNYLPQRTAVVLDQFKEAGFLPEVEAPVFSVNGGEFGEIVDLIMEAAEGTIYYTLDDSDPREFGGELAQDRALGYSNPIKLYQDVVVKARTKVGDEWSAITRAKFEISSVSASLITQTICEGEEYLGFETEGSHYILTTSSMGTDSLIEVRLSVNPKPDVNIGADTTILVNEIITLESNLDYPTYLWSTDETTHQISVNLQEAGTFKYWLTVEDHLGCLNTDTVTVTVELPLAIGRSNTSMVNYFPNPTSGLLTIQLTNELEGKTVIEIYNSNGQRVFLKEGVRQKEITISTEKFVAGVYVVRITNRKETASYRLIKQ